LAKNLSDWWLVNQWSLRQKNQWVMLAANICGHDICSSNQPVDQGHQKLLVIHKTIALEATYFLMKNFSKFGQNRFTTRPAITKPAAKIFHKGNGSLKK